MGEDGSGNPAVGGTNAPVREIPRSVSGAEELAGGLDDLVG